MKKQLNAITLLLVMVLFLSACTKKETLNEPKSGPFELSKNEYLSKVDVEYAYNFAKSLEEYKTNEKLGYRTAGSQAEIQTGNTIFEEMKKIGLSEVTRDEITVDTWEFEKADLTFTDENGQEHQAVLGAYQTNFDTKGFKEFDVIYAGKGTKNDLSELDVKDKLVLIDINQREEWWINYPAYQAYLKDAAAVIAVQQGGYAEVDPSSVKRTGYYRSSRCPGIFHVTS